jgi:LysR family cyn operon transcriptional activator
VETLSIVVGSSHPRANRRKALSGADFEKEPLVLLNNDFATRLYINQYCKQSGVTPRVAIEANSISAIVEIVRRGRLATILPDRIAREHPGLHSVPIDPAMPTRTAALLQRKGAYRTAAAKAFVALLAEDL